jgi:hypothetical protein
MSKRWIVAILVMVSMALTQDVKPKVKVSEPDLNLTADEKFEVRTVQTNLLSAQLAERDARDASAQAQAVMQQKVAEIFSKHKVTAQEYAICAGPSPGACVGVVNNDIVLRPRPKPEIEKGK